MDQVLDGFGIVCLSHESTERKAAALTDNYAAELTVNIHMYTHMDIHPLPFPPAFSLELSSFFRFSVRLVRWFLRLVSLPAPRVWFVCFSPAFSFLFLGLPFC